MPVLIRLDKIHKAYGGRVLLNEAALQLTDEHRYGVVGRNGTGKSTLCRMILGQEEPDSGQIWTSDDLRLSYLEQHDPFHDDESVHDFLIRYADQPEWRCAEVAYRFDLHEAELASPVRALSGGYQTRVKLAGMLLREPNFLLLDEPTNFLDLRTQFLLERFLADWRGGALIVSHDRLFLEAVCDRTIAVEHGDLIDHPGRLTNWLTFRAEQREHIARANASIAVKRKQLKRFIDSNRANANTASQARSKQKQLERLETTELPDDEVPLRLQLPQVDKRSGTALLVRDLVIGYPGKVIARDIDFEIEYGSRVAIVGDNGQGKTTLVRSLCDDLALLGGVMKWGYGCELGVYAQHVYTSIPASETVFGYLTRMAVPGTQRQPILDTAGTFLFRGDEVEKQVAVLSGGERARLCLAGLLLARPTVLLLDEPTNHLDVETIAALASGLEEYLGTVLVVSHDRSFVEQIATQVVRVHEGGVVSYPGSYADYCYRTRDELIAHTTRLEPQTQAAAPRSGRQIHDIQKRIASAERKLARLDDQRRALEAELETAAVERAIALGGELGTLGTEIGSWEERWLSLQEELEAAGGG